LKNTELKSDAAKIAVTADLAAQTSEWRRTQESLRPSEEDSGGFMEDMAAGRHLEGQLLQAQKMETDGQPAAGAAHDFNNVLTATLLHLGLLRQSPQLTEAQKQSLKLVERETQRASKLIRQLLLSSGIPAIEETTSGPETILPAEDKPVDVRLLLVDDHPLLLRGLCQAVAQQPNLILVGEASTGAMALKLAQELTPDLVVMDLHLPDMNGIEATRQILRAQPAIKIVIFSSDTARPMVDAALQAGVCGYLSKSSALEELMRAMALVMEGKLYLSPDVSAGILADYKKTLVDGPEPSKPILSERERQLLRLVAAGRRNKEIADQMAISAKSVETYRSRLMKKLGCSGSAELVRYAIREGIAAL
jgi:DNA-binding NarL/FixJ family response regulator